MATTAAQDKISKILLFSTADHLGNEIVCTQKTWSGHVVSGHPEMRGREDEVKAALASPDAVYCSTISSNALIYELDTAADQIRVVATFDDISSYEEGSGIAKVNTSYPVDGVVYDKPNIGTPIYQRIVTTADVPNEPEKKGGKK